MKNIPTFENFLTESLNASHKKTKKTKIKISFEIDWNDKIGKVEDEFTLAFSPDSSGIYSIGDDIEKFIGIPEADVKRDISKGKETPEDAIIYGMCNCMNGGKDIFFWSNGTRLSGEVTKVGLWPAIMELISHEAGIHLTRLILARAIAKNKGISIDDDKWVNEPWPSIGDDPKINDIDEEAFATVSGLVIQQITSQFLKMASDYLPQLNLLPK